MSEAEIYLIFTDGVSETMNRQGEEYGFERIAELLKHHGDRSAEEILDRILDQCAASVAAPKRKTT